MPTTPSALRTLLRSLHLACKRERVGRPTDLSSCDSYIREFLLAHPDTLADYVNTGEMSELEDLLPNLFDENKADPVELVLVLKRELRMRAREGMDREYEKALIAGEFAWMDAA